MGRITVRPVTAATRDDLVRLFEARGSPHFCWCVPYRFRDAHAYGPAQRKAAMLALVDAGTPVGVLAHDGDDPVGWCSVAPRETYARLERSRSMPRATPADVSTWTVLCFFVVRSHRGKGVSRTLLQGAVAYARSQGASVIEGFPFDTAGISSTHRGHSSVFASARFRQDGSRWSLPVVRR